jgi:hypothetical protein
MSSFRSSRGRFADEADDDRNDPLSPTAGGAGAASANAEAEAAAAASADAQEAAMQSQEFKDIMMENEILAKENRLFHAYLHRNLSDVREEDIDGVDLPLPAGAAPPSGNIPLALKFAMALQEQDIRVQQLKDLSDKVVEDVSLLRAIIEAVKVRTDELRKDTYEFQRDVVVRGEHPRTGQVMAEAVLGFLSQRLGGRHALAQKLVSKAKVLKEQRAKLEAQTQSREGQKGRPLSTDFHQLQIKNQQSSQKIRELNAELFRAKASTVRVVQQLNTRRKELAEASAKGARLKGDKHERAAAASRLKAELDTVEREVRADQARQRVLQVQQSNPDVPHVIDYVQQKALASELAAEVRSWARKVEIAQMAATRAKHALQRATALRTQQAEAVRKSLQAGGSMFLPPLAGARK